jgi:hypothetical protein
MFGRGMRIRFYTRLWYYFRLGYSTYLTFLLGYGSTLVTVYYLAIKNLPALLNIFPHFVPFAVIATALGAPLSVAIGWAHLKRTSAFASEQDISVEASPYTYKLPSGFWREAYFPLYLELLAGMRRLVEAQGKLSVEEKSWIERLERNLKVLVNGGYVGTPRRSKFS